MTADNDPLLAAVDPNRDFITKAIKFLQSRSDEGDREAYHILREFFIHSYMQNLDDLPERIERQLVFRDGHVGDKLEALTELREAFRFMRGDVYDVFTGQRHPKSRELCDMLTKTENALDVLSAGYVDSEGLRGMVERIEMEDPDDEFIVIPLDAIPIYEIDGNVINIKKIPAK